MPITAAGMSAAIKAQLDAHFPTGETEDGETNGEEQRRDFCDAVAAGVVDYLKANALVTGVCPSGGGPLASGVIT